MDPAAPATIAGLCVAAAALGWRWLRHPHPAGPLAAREPVPAEGPALPPPTHRGSAMERGVELAGAWAQPAIARLLGPAQLAEVRRRLLAAGRPDDLTVERYLRRSIGSALLGLVIGVVLALAGQLALGIVVTVVTAVSNELWLRAAVARRQRRVTAELPDFLDVLAVSLGAGRGLRPALLRTAATLGGVLGEEVSASVRAMDVGVAWRPALEQLRERNPAPALHRFVGAAIQAESLGAPLVETVREQAQQLRVEAGQRARQRAARAEPRVIAITGIFLLPAVLLLMLVTIGLSVAGSLSGVGG